MKEIGKCPKCGTRYVPAPGYEHDNSIQLIRCDCLRDHPEKVWEQLDRVQSTGRLEHGQGAQPELGERIERIAHKASELASQLSQSVDVSDDESFKAHEIAQLMSELMIANESVKHLCTPAAPPEQPQGERIEGRQSPMDFTKLREHSREGIHIDDEPAGDSAGLASAFSGMDAKATVALDGDTRRSCNNPDCSNDYPCSVHAASLADRGEGPQVKNFDWVCNNCGYHDNPTVPGKPTICPQCGWNNWRTDRPLMAEY